VTGRGGGIDRVAGPLTENPATLRRGGAHIDTLLCQAAKSKSSNERRSSTQTAPPSAARVDRVADAFSDMFRYLLYLEYRSYANFPRYFDSIHESSEIVGSPLRMSSRRRLRRQCTYPPPMLISNS